MRFDVSQVKRDASAANDTGNKAGPSVLKASAPIKR